MNFTIPELQKAGDACFEWCRDQNVAHQNNISIYRLSLLMLALLSMLMFELLSRAEINDVNQKDLERFRNGCFYFSEMMIIAYLVITAFGF